MQFNINDYNDTHVMHCKDEKEIRSFLAVLDNAGLTWSVGVPYTDFDWLKNLLDNIEGDDIVFYFTNGTYSTYEYAKDNGYKILEWSDFMEKEFTKADLKTGDVTMRRNGAVEIVNLDLRMFIGKTGWNDLDALNDDLTHIGDDKTDWDIIAVRRPLEKFHCAFSAFTRKYGTVVYERKEQ